MGSGAISDSATFGTGSRRGFYRPVATAGAAPPTAMHRHIAVWLLACAALVFAIVVVGGITRLTRSGLSIAEWRPVTGVLPPLSQADWQDAFSAYRATPEYRIVNRGMSLEAFERIFWWEWVHRLLARVVALAYLLPLLWWLARGAIPSGYRWRLTGLVLLVGLQGVLGWLMVKSGLVDRPQVSHLRLTAHLGLALLLLAATLWTAFSLGTRERLPDIPAAARARRWARVVTCLVCVMIVTGGLVAGFRAGYVYNTWPLMNGTLAPSELLLLTPWWRNVVWNMVTIQFDHRMVAYGLLLSVVGLGVSLRDPGLPARARRAGLALAVAVVAQAVLGISTLLLVVPILLAVLHQALAVVVFALALHVLYALR